MNHYKAFEDTSKIYQTSRDHMFSWRELESISIREATKQAVTFHDAKYKRSDPAFISDSYDHLDSL